MLVLGRKKGESLVITGPAVVTIVDSRDGTIRVGVTAPDTTRVARVDLTPVSYEHGVAAAERQRLEKLEERAKNAG